MPIHRERFFGTNIRDAIRSLRGDQAHYDCATVQISQEDIDKLREFIDALVNIPGDAYLAEEAGKLGLKAYMVLDNLQTGESHENQ